MALRYAWPSADEMGMQASWRSTSLTPDHASALLGRRGVGWGGGGCGSEC